MRAPSDTAPLAEVDLQAVYHELRRSAGHRGWWPGRTRFEIILGAILTQNTSWKNVEKALAGLRRRGLLRPGPLTQIPEGQLAELIRPSGYFRQKARKIRAFLELLQRDYGGLLAAMAREPTESLRSRLLSVWGIGPETADSILLYAFGRPVFVVDTYTKRVLVRHGWVRAQGGYAEIQGFHASRLPGEVDLFNDFHAQYVWVGHHYCGTVPHCESCPLREFLPPSGAVDDRKISGNRAEGSL